MKTIILNYPVSLNKYKVRIHAGLISFFCFLSLVFFYINPMISILIASLVWLDFIISLIFSPQYSIFSPITNFIFLKISKEEWISSKPKRFAKFCGSLFISTSIIVYCFEIYIAYQFLILILGIFSFLESFFDFCIACKLYSLAQNMGIIEKDSCENC